MNNSSSPPGLIYGPVRSRRLGLSLGINLLPTPYKLCSFSCIYCQYRRVKKSRFVPANELKILPKPEEVGAALEAALLRLSGDGESVDSIAICGNGEPTLYPDLRGVIDRVQRLRDQYLPQARLAILSNSSTVGNNTVRDALKRLDLRIMKFDAGSEEMFRQLNHPVTPVYMGEIVAGLKELTNTYLESLFLQGKVSNVDPDSVDVWVEKLREIQPLGVQIYTLDCVSPEQRLEKVNLSTLQWIAEQVRWRTGLPAEVI
ncbi:MAG: radical SAM protein [Chloroflexota bacterium]